MRYSNSPCGRCLPASTAPPSHSAPGRHPALQAGGRAAHASAGATQRRPRPAQGPPAQHPRRGLQEFTTGWFIQEDEGRVGQQLHANVAPLALCRAGAAGRGGAGQGQPEKPGVPSRVALLPPAGMQAGTAAAAASTPARSPPPDTPRMNALPMYVPAALPSASSLMMSSTSCGTPAEGGRRWCVGGHRRWEDGVQQWAEQEGWRPVRPMHGVNAACGAHTCRTRTHTGAARPDGAPPPGPAPACASAW